MPWVVSAGLHLCVVLMLSFVLFQPESGEEDAFLVAYSADSLPRRVEQRPMRTRVVTHDEFERDSASEVFLHDSAGDFADVSGAEAENISSMDESSLLRDVADDYASSSDLETHGTSEVDSTTFFGEKVRADDVVFLIDFSTSLQGSFAEIRREMLRSIGQLEEEQKFHIVLFAGGRPLEPYAGGLVPADREHKSKAASFLARVKPAGRTDPVPAMSRAFAVLRGSRSESQLICLLTDGAFPDERRVMRAIGRYNSSGRVRINTYLYGDGNSYAAGMLHRIATENGGRFVRVGRR